ncbi:MAG: hypothetical protein ALAOOOJD_04333 [bacterium]|nr:hypothetical protein [bacterium]
MAAVHGAACYRTVNIAVCIGVNRRLVFANIAIYSGAATHTFGLAPAIILAGLDDIDFFPAIESHVAHPNFAGDMIDVETPGIAKSVSKNLLAITLIVAGKRIIQRDAISQTFGRIVDIKAKELTQQLG